jgi:hypothetical protein
MAVAISEFYTQSINLEYFSFLETIKYQAGSLITRQITHYIRLSYLLIYCSLLTLAAIIFLKNKLGKTSHPALGPLFSIVIGLSLLLFLRYGATEIDDRVYLLALVPMAAIIILTYPNKVIIPLMVILLVLHVPAHYGTEFFDQVRTSELTGAEFLSQNMPNKNILYSYSFPTLVEYYDPKKILIGYRAFNASYAPDVSILGSVAFIIDSIETEYFHTYSYGYDPQKEWIKKNEEVLNKIYQNGYFTSFYSERLFIY